MVNAPFFVPSYIHVYIHTYSFLFNWLSFLQLVHARPGLDPWQRMHGIYGKGKGFPHSTPSVGPGADPGVQAVSLQVTVKSSTRR